MKQKCGKEDWSSHEAGNSMWTTVIILWEPMHFFFWKTHRSHQCSEWTWRISFQMISRKWLSQSQKYVHQKLQAFLKVHSCKVTKQDWNLWQNDRCLHCMTLLMTSSFCHFIFFPSGQLWLMKLTLLTPDTAAWAACDWLTISSLMIPTDLHKWQAWQTCPWLLYLLWNRNFNGSHVMWPALRLRGKSICLAEQTGWTNHSFIWCQLWLEIQFKMML